MATLENAVRIAFGLFEVDLQSGEIWKSGFRVRLQGQPFKVLAALLAKPGQVVTRAELQMQVWGPDTNVDFERALAVAINKIREALADSAENPRFIETLAKRGYRFVAPVTVISTAASSLAMHGEPQPPTNLAVHSEQVFRVAEQTPSLSENPLKLDPGQKLIAEVPLASTRLSNEKIHAFSGHEVALTSAIALLLILVATLLLIKRPLALSVLRVDQLTHNSPVSAGPPGMESLLTLATDGDRILTSVLAEGKSQLAAINISTGDMQPIAIPGELASATLTDISRDGSHLLLRSHLSSHTEQPLWVVPTAGGSALRVGNVLAQDATWMPDGNSILFAKGDDLTLVHLDGGTTMPYAKLPGRAFSLRWSPDGKLLRFTVMDPLTHTSSIWELKESSRTTRPLFGNGKSQVLECCGTWTADGKAYVFQRSDNLSSNLWEAEGDGANPNLTQLTNGPLSYFSPVAARSGHRIFFYGSAQPSGLQRYNGERLGFQPERTFLVNANRVDYSRDGKWVAWTDEAGRLWRARSEDGSEKLQLTPDYLDVFLAHWSPDESKLAIMARQPGEAWQIYLLSADGGKPERLLKDLRNAADPGWSPDGRRLVYGREPDSMGKESGSHAIEILDLESRKATTLPQSEGLFSPRWSPNGKWIVALTLDQNKVMIFDVAKDQWRELASTSASDPVWSSDSKAVYIHAFMAEKEPILRISLQGGKMQTVASTMDFRFGESANYFFGGLTPNNIPLVRPRVGTGDLYMLDLDRR